MKDKVVIVTGGTRGIGLGITHSFLAQGAKVVVNFRSNYHSAENVKDELALYKNAFLFVQGDVGIASDRSNLVKTAISHFGRIDVLVNNAGISARKGFLKGDEEEFDAIINTNLKGPIFLAQACAQQMIADGIKGAIINISSTSAHSPNAPTVYCVSKSGLNMATKSMSLQLGPYGIRVNTVTPGTIQSDMNRRVWHDNPELWDKIVKTMPLQRGGMPSELANAVVFLASDAAAYITGGELIVDGGCLLRQPQ